MIPIRVIHTHGRQPRETEHELFMRLAGERRRQRRQARRGRVLRALRRKPAA